ncbi:hypothetical protein [Kitasatospora sp. NPDC051705]|uniref:hypothetical protein n=1 Tax=Kitasatospora sp. NPDC051705 TaxID=3364057 RepID=UPI00379376CD
MAHPLTLLRATLGLSQPEYARLLSHTHRDLGLGTMAARREKVSRWESGRIVPEFTAQLAMAHLHGVPAAEVRRLGWPHWTHLATRDTVLLDQPYTDEGAAAVLASTAQPAESSQPQALALCGAALAGQLRSALERLTSSPSRPQGSLPEDLAGRVTGIEARVGALEAQEHGTLLSPAGLYAGAHAEHRLVVALLARHGHGHPAAPALFALAARTALVCGWLSGALGEAARAERHNLAAIRAAAEGGHPGLAAQAMIQLARHHLVAGAADDAMLYIRATRSADPRAPAAAAVALHNNEAVAFARLGRARTAALALERADRCLTEVPATADGPPDDGAYRLYRSVTQAAVWWYLGEPRRAEPYFRPVTDFLLSPHTTTLSPHTALWLLYTVDTHLALDELDVAAEATHQAIDLTGTLPPGLAREYHRRLTPHRHEPLIHHALDHLHDTGSA